MRGCHDADCLLNKPWQGLTSALLCAGVPRGLGGVAPRGAVVWRLQRLPPWPRGVLPQEPGACGGLRLANCCVSGSQKWLPVSSLLSWRRAAGYNVMWPPMRVEYQHCRCA